MTCVVILAGGKSSRMGKDKAFLRGGVARIRQLALDAGVERVVTLGGDELRCELFEGEVIADPQGANGIGEILFSVINQIDDDIQLIPCDAYSLQSDGLQALLELEQGVPLDSEGKRQLLMARLAKDRCLDVGGDAQNTSSRGRAWKDYIAHIPSVGMGEMAGQIRNFNRPEDLV